jgi:hypothetical protein
MGYLGQVTLLTDQTVVANSSSAYDVDFPFAFSKPILEQWANTANFMYYCGDTVYSTASREKVGD